MLYINIVIIIILYKYGMKLQIHKKTYLLSGIENDLCFS